MPKDYKGMAWYSKAKTKSSQQSPNKRRLSQPAEYTLGKPDELPTREGEKLKKGAEQPNSPLSSACNKKTARVSPNGKDTAEDADELSTERQEPTKSAEQSSNPLSRPSTANGHRIYPEQNDDLRKLDEVSAQKDAERPRRLHSRPWARPDIRGSKLRQAHRAEKNQHVDRTTAKLGSFDPSKLQVQVIDVDDKLLSLDYSVLVDWNDPRSISALNKWRGRFFRKWLGSLPQSLASVPYLEEEREWIRETIRSLERPPNWKSIAHDFNEKFEGNVISGSTVPRPKRNSDQLGCMTRRLRVKGELEATMQSKSAQSKQIQGPFPGTEDVKANDDTKGYGDDTGDVLKVSKSGG